MLSRLKETPLPISVRTAKSLIVEVEPAKYGKGTQTLLDCSVRDVWKISQVDIDTMLIDIPGQFFKGH